MICRPVGLPNGALQCDSHSCSVAYCNPASWEDVGVGESTCLLNYLLVG